jgi:hypothetical protein
MPRKTFVAGEVLLAQDVNQFLMDQSVMNFATSAARSSAIPTPTEGMTSYISTTGTASIPQIETYTGSQWQTPYGLTLLNSTSIPAATQVSVNNVFTSAYRNYLVLIDVTKHTGSTINLSMRLRAGGVDNTAAVYDLQTNGREGTTQFGLLATSDTYGFATGPRDTQTFVGQFFSPNVSSPTKIINTGTSGNSNGTFFSAYLQFAHHRDNYQADGFTAFFTNSTNGVVRVYGYRD